MTRSQKLVGLFLVLSAAYLWLTLATPPDPAALNKYHISTSQIHVLSLAIAVPYIAIWIVALIGYLKLKSYTSHISTSKDGAALEKVSQGVLALFLWLPLSAVVSALGLYISSKRHSLTADMVRLDIYLNLIILLIAFWLLYKGGGKLLTLVKTPAYTVPLKIVIPFLAFSVAYVALVLHDPVRQFPSTEVARSTYYLPDWLLVTTVLIPRIVMWYLGLRAIIGVALYSKHVRGSIYKQALGNLSLGIGWVIISIVVLRTIQTLSTTLSHWGLGLLLLLIYVLLIIIAIGYILIYKGAKQLQRIEDI